MRTKVSVSRFSGLKHATVLLIGLFIPHQAIAVTFSDPGTFATPQWSESIFGGGDVVDTRENTGGNPDDFLRIQTIPSGGTIVIGGYLNSAATYDPSTQGAIASIDLGIDVALFVGVTGFTDGQGFGTILEQNGQVFGNGFAVTGLNNSFNSRTILGSAESNFGLISANGNTNFGINPDFSSSGSSITFGFSAANSGSSPISGSTAGYDNWSVTVNQVNPQQVAEPGTLALFAIGLAGLGFVRRRKPA
jgi:hypothetical protein